jgi:protein SCO1/2
MKNEDRHPVTLPPFRNVRLALWAAVVVLGAAVLWFTVIDRDRVPGIAAAASIGGPFSLTDQTGVTVTEAALQGHPSALFFGYTNCPDVCPATLADITTWLAQLGASSDTLKVYFVTVDPERDTPAHMKSYLEAFDPRITGLTGTRPQIDAMLKEYRVYSRKVGDRPDYSMDHAASVYLLDAKGEFVGTVDWQEKEESVMAKLKRLVGA